MSEPKWRNRHLLWNNLPWTGYQLSPRRAFDNCYTRRIMGIQRRKNKKESSRRSLNSNHHLVKFFPRFVGGRMVSHPHREPKVLSFLLPLSRHASSPLLPTRKHLCFPSVTLPHHQKPPKPSTSSYTKPATVFTYTPLTI